MTWNNLYTYELLHHLIVDQNLKFFLEELDQIEEQWRASITWLWHCN